MEIVTKRDLQEFKIELIREITLLFATSQRQPAVDPEGYKTRDARRILKCSAGTLKSLKISGKIRSKKIRGALYYHKGDVNKLVSEGFK